MHIVLIGLSGSGKSSLGRQAAEALGLPFVDLDEQIEREAGLCVRDIFAQHGEADFREREARAVRAAAAAPDPSVIATGGGAVLRPDNVRLLRETGFLIFLDRPVAHIARHMAYDGSRPLVSGAQDLEALAARRRPLYEAAAHATLRNDAGCGEALAALLALVSTWSPRSGNQKQEFGTWVADATHIRPQNPPEGYAVVGDPIAHTLSPPLHRAVFDALGVADAYTALHVPRGTLAAFVSKLRAGGLKGCNVTIPHKRDILPLLDEVEEEARLCGAVNTVVVRAGRLCGYNTDMEGLLTALRAAGRGYRDQTLLLLGAGGAAGGVALKAAREGARAIVVLARRAPQAGALAAAVRAAVPAAPVRAGVLSPAAAEAEARAADLLVNATPLGMQSAAADFDDLSFVEALPPHALVCDLVYNPPRTRLLRAAEARGLAVQNGLDMLIYQALLADERFLGRTLDKTALYPVAKRAIEKEGDEADDHYFETRGQRGAGRGDPAGDGGAGPDDPGHPG
ncbi:MAG: shikimate dehydrogenase [Oscillospiraceae bacterium]|jgi:shikimate dehydrogenase|nr:shikimate dehydrogenase [Oscillospiraceae bacterium]